MKRRVLFLCTGNACRSPMAEAFLHQMAPDRYESLSAGSNPAGYVHPLTVRVMAEVGIDVSGHRSSHIADFLPPQGSPPDVIVSLCDFAARHCPRFPEGTGKVHWPTFDPIVVDGNRDLRLDAFRGVREEIRSRIEQALRTGELDRPPEAFGPPPRHPGIEWLRSSIDALLGRGRP